MNHPHRDGATYAPTATTARKVCEPGDFTFAAVGLDHGHIYGMCNGLLEAGARLRWVYDPDNAKVEQFRARYPDVKAARSEQEALDDPEVSLIAGAAIGKPSLAYVELPAEQVIQAMTGMGMSKNFATLICEMSDALNNGYMRALEPRNEKNTTPTSFETFVQEIFLPAYKGQAASA